MTSDPKNDSIIFNVSVFFENFQMLYVICSFSRSRRLAILSVLSRQRATCLLCRLIIFDIFSLKAHLSHILLIIKASSEPLQD